VVKAMVFIHGESQVPGIGVVMGDTTTDENRAPALLKHTTADSSKYYNGDQFLQGEKIVVTQILFNRAQDYKGLI
jgi:hypothetical protein